MIKAEVKIITNNSAKMRGMSDAIVKQLVAELTGVGEVRAKQEAQRLIYDAPPSPTYERTGNLMNSISSKVKADGDGQISSDAEYSRYVNDGTAHNPPRPYIDNMLKQLEREVEPRANKLASREGLK